MLHFKRWVINSFMWLCVCWCRIFLIFFSFSFVHFCSTLQHFYSIFHDFHRNFVFIAHTGFWVSYKSIINFHHGRSRINSSSTNTIQLYVVYWIVELTNKNHTKAKTGKCFRIFSLQLQSDLFIYFIDFIFVPEQNANEWIIWNESTSFWIITGQFINWRTALLYSIQNCSFHRLITST